MAGNDLEDFGKECLKSEKKAESSKPGILNLFPGKEVKKEENNESFKKDEAIKQVISMQNATSNALSELSERLNQLSEVVLKREYAESLPDEVKDQAELFYESEKDALGEKDPEELDGMMIIPAQSVAIDQGKIQEIISMLDKYNIKWDDIRRIKKP